MVPSTVEEGQEAETARGKYWYKISKFTFSKGAFFNLAVGLSCYLYDTLTDVLLILSYQAEGRVKECALIAALILASGMFTSVYYRANENWIDEDHELLKPTNKHREFWKRLRVVSQCLLLTPIFRFFFSWKELKMKKHSVKAQYYNRKPINSDEVNSVVRLSENNIVQCSFHLIQCFTEGLPQAVLQIYLLCVSDPAQLGLDTWIGRLRIGAVIVPIISASFISTRYYQAYYNHLYTLYYKDYYDYGSPLQYSNFTKVNFVLSFFANLFVIGVRIIGMTCILVQHGVIHFVGFITVLFFYQLIWLELCPDSRVKYENPPRGKTDLLSNTIDRLVNVFTFHNVYPNKWNLFTYQALFLALFCFFEYLFPTQSTMLSLLQVNHNENLIAMTNSTNSTSQFNCFSYLDLFQNRYMMLTLFLLSLILTISYAVSLKRCGAFVQDHIPLGKVYRFWDEILHKDDLLTCQIRRCICLCVTASSQEFSKLLHVFPLSCEAQSTRCIHKLEMLWKQKVSELSCPDSRPTLREKWEACRTSIVDTRSHLLYIGKLTNFIENNIENKDGIDSEVNLNNELRMFLKMCIDFRSYASSMSSHRLGKISTIINFVRKNVDCIFDDVNWPDRQLLIDEFIESVVFD